MWIQSAKQFMMTKTCVYHAVCYLNCFHLCVCTIIIRIYKAEHFMDNVYIGPLSRSRFSLNSEYVNPGKRETLGFPFHRRRPTVNCFTFITFVYL